MKRLILSAALAVALAAPASAGCLPLSQTALTAVEAADAYSIASMKWHGSPAYDQTMPLCAKSLVNEIACQGAANLIIRHFEKPSIGTCIANYVAAIGYGWYIRRAVSATVISIRF
jgi:hypothetical protein